MDKKKLTAILGACVATLTVHQAKAITAVAGGGALAFMASSAKALPPQPVALPGQYTLAAGPDNLTDNLPATAYPYNTTWVTDRPGGAGYMVSNGTIWQTEVGATGPAGSSGSAATISVGTVSTGSPGSFTTIANVGSSSAAVFNFAIPRGDVGATGGIGPAGPSSVSGPNSRSMSFNTAYQATDNTKPAIVNINLTSTANLSLSGGTTNTATVYMGSTNAVASGTGTAICSYSNSSTGTLTIGLNTNTVSATTCSFLIPAGWFWAYRVASGTVTINSTLDQALG